MDLNIIYYIYIYTPYHNLRMYLVIMISRFKSGERNKLKKDL